MSHNPFHSQGNETGSVSLRPDLAPRTAKGQMLTSTHGDKGVGLFVSLGCARQITNIFKIMVFALPKALALSAAEEGHFP